MSVCEVWVGGLVGACILKDIVISSLYKKFENGTTVLHDVVMNTDSYIFSWE